MPSRTHQCLIKLLAESPWLVPRLLRDQLGLPFPEPFEVVGAPETIREGRYPEYAADGTIVVRDPQTGQREAFIVEVQLRRDPAKRRTWPLYVAGLRLRLECSTTLVVVTDNDRIAAWCREPIDLGHGRMVLRPIVIGPAEIPQQLDDATACDNPELAVLAVIAHGTKPGAERLGHAALRASQQLATTDQLRATLYADLILGFLSPAAVQALENEMGITTDAYISDFAKRYVSKGKAEGKAEGRAESLLLVLQSRGLAISEAARTTISTSDDPEQLTRWLMRASSVGSVEELLDDE